MEERHLIVVPDELRKMRLEDALLTLFPRVSKMYIRELVRGGRCEVNGREENIGRRLRAGDLIEIDVDAARGTAMRPEGMALDIVFEDAHILVVNKPAGMLMHPSHRENTRTLLNGVVHHLNDGRERIIRPGLPHRLDKQTSGLVVIAKTPKAHRTLSAGFMHKLVEKRYLAVVEGIVTADSDTIFAPIGRYAESKHWSVKDDGKHSESRFLVRERRYDTTLLELEPVTGRTNQLRIHCELIGHPIVGDIERGGRRAERLFLHAFRLCFKHPATGEMMEFERAAEF